MIISPVKSRDFAEMLNAYFKSVVVIDNDIFHRNKQLTLLTQNKGYRIIFLPLYLLEINYIEYFWAFLKQKLKKCLYNFSNLDDTLYYCFNCN